jgi:hypothetical protein
MENIFEIDLDPNYHISTFPTTHVRKFALYIPPIEQYLPTENHYFGLEEMTYGNLVIDQENGGISTTVRHFFKDMLNNKTYAYEIACTPAPLIHNELGQEIMTFAKENLITHDLADNYMREFNNAKLNGQHARVFRFGTILTRLCKGLRTTEMTDAEHFIYSELLDDKISLRDTALELNYMTNVVQGLVKTSGDLFPPVDMKYVNQFLVRIHKEYYKI